MNWLTRKIRNYIWPVLLYCYNSCAYFLSVKKNSTCILLANFDGYGGTRTYFEQLVQFLSEKNKRVICLVSEKQKDHAFLELMKKLDFDYVVIPDKDYVIEYSGRWNWKMYSFYLNKLLIDLNLFIFYCRKYKAGSFFISSGDPGQWLYLFWLPVRKMFYVLHTLPYRSIGSIGNYTLQRKLSVKKCIITVSDFSKKTISSCWNLFNDQQEYVKVVYNFYKPVVNSLSKNSHPRVRVLTIGHVVDYKNPFFWITVAKTVLSKAENGKVEFVWAGDGNCMEACTNMVKENNFIQFIGYRKDVDDLYINSDIYFQPSVVESHGIAVVGAMSYGLPCVVSEVGGLSESVIHNYNGYTFSVTSETEAVNYLLTLINDEPKRKEIGCNSKSRFYQLFTERQWKSKMQELI